MKRIKKLRPKYAVGSLVVLGLFVGGLILAPVVYADRFDEQINSLRQENAANEQADQLLEVEEQNIAASVARIQGEISAIEEQIRLNEAKRNETAVKIAAAEAELTRQKELLGEVIEAMYVSGDISTLEMLATSNNLSDFIDAQEYQNSVQTKVQESLDKIATLKRDLDKQKQTVEKLLADQQSMQERLAVQRAEQTRLLSMNQEQQAAHENKMASNNSRIAELRKQQIAENSRFLGSGARGNIPDTSGYPWANAAFPDSPVDPWGMYQRQCVSYTAWKVWKSGRYMPYWGGVGNANQWDDNARAAGIPVDGNPRAGDIAVSNKGYYGHVMYVEAVYDDGTIYISQYNAAWDGRYSEARIPIGSLVFIHF